MACLLRFVRCVVIGLMVLGMIAGVFGRVIPVTYSHSHAVAAVHSHAGEGPLAADFHDPESHHDHDHDDEGSGPVNEHHHHCSLGDVSPLAVEFAAEWKGCLIDGRMLALLPGSLDVPEGPYLDLNKPPQIG